MEGYKKFKRDIAGERISQIQIARNLDGTHHCYRNT